MAEHLFGFFFHFVVSKFVIVLLLALKRVGMKNFLLLFFPQCFDKSQYILVFVDQLVADQVQRQCGDDINDCMLFQENRG